MSIVIVNAGKLLLRELRAFLVAENGGEGNVAPDGPDFAVLGNIAMADVSDLNPTISERVVISFVNDAEEAAFKNAPHSERSGNGTRYRNAPKYLNLFVLFSANYADYETALRRLSQVVTFFQGKQVFTHRDSPAQDSVDDPFMEMKLIMELFALSFEQVNYLWASLGGKQMPFVLYKVRLVRIESERTAGDAPLIERITATETAV